MPMTFRLAKKMADNVGLILERASQVCDGERTRYALYNNYSGVTALCSDLDEVIAEVMTWQHDVQAEAKAKHKSFADILTERSRQRQESARRAMSVGKV